MRVWALLLLSSPLAAADPPASSLDTLHLHRLSEADSEPLLHLDATLLDPTNAQGGISEHETSVFELGPRTRLVTEGSWWQTGLSPSAYASDLRDHGWRAAGELSYDVGWFRAGVNASLTRDGDGTRRTTGVFATKSLELSRWMHAWISLGISWEQWQGNGVVPPRQGATIGLSLGTTFR